MSWQSTWMTLGWNRVEIFSQVELAEELVETEEEMKKELSQEFTRWRKQKKIGTISNNFKGSRLCRSVIPCRALRKPMVANFVLMWVLVRDYLETICSLCVLNGNYLFISLSFSSLQWLTMAGLEMLSEILKSYFIGGNFRQPTTMLLLIVIKNPGPSLVD